MICLARAISPGTFAPASTTSALVSADDLQYRERNADQIVEVRPSGVDPIAGTEHSGDHLLRAGLSICPSDGDDGAGDLPATRPCQTTERDQRVRHGEEPEIGDGPGSGPDHRTARACGRHRRKVVVPVEPLAGQRHEQRAWCNNTAVGRDAGEREWCCSGLRGQVERRQYIGFAPTHARAAGLRFSGHRRPFTACSTISRSSNGTFSVPMT